MSAEIISFDVVRVRGFAKRLIELHDQIDATAKAMLAGRRADARLEELLDAVDGVLTKLDKIAFTLTDQKVRDAVRATTLAHASWSCARLGSDEEQRAAQKYLAGVDALAKIVGLR